MQIVEEKNGVVFVETKGYCMWPFLKGKEKLIIKKVPLSDLKKGDLILYTMQNQLICHRFITLAKVTGRVCIFARADASMGKADVVEEEMFLGKVISLIRGNKLTDMEGLPIRLKNRLIICILPLINGAHKAYQYFRVRR